MSEVLQATRSFVSMLLVWRVRTLVDLLYRVHQMDAYTDVLGPYEIPEDPQEVPAFISRCREIIVGRLAELRGDEPASDGTA